MKLKSSITDEDLNIYVNDIKPYDLLSVPEHKLFAIGVRLSALDKGKQIVLKSGKKEYLALNGYDWFGWVAVVPNDFSELIKLIKEVKLPDGFIYASVADGFITDDSVYKIDCEYDYFKTKLPALNAPKMDIDLSSGQFAQAGDWTPKAALWSLDLCALRSIPEVWSDVWYKKLLLDTYEYVESINEILKYNLPAVKYLGLKDISGEDYWQNKLLKYSDVLISSVEKLDIQKVVKPGVINKKTSM